MNKYILGVMAVSSLSTFAADLSDFQAFDNQVNVGFGLQQEEATAPGNSGSSVMGSNQVYSLEGERILNNGVYVDVMANLAFTSTPTNMTSPLMSNYGLNGKVGYAFDVADSHLLLTPYGLFGMNNNGLMGLNNASLMTAGSTASVASSFFYTYGVGGRIEYRINDSILVYADQNYMMNMDQTRYAPGIEAQNVNSAMSTLGVKFNLVDLFQVGVRGMYTTYMPQASNNSMVPGMTLSQPQSSMSAMVTLGLLF